MSLGETDSTAGEEEEPERLISDRNKILHKQACCQPELARYPTVWQWVRMCKRARTGIHVLPL